MGLRELYLTFKKQEVEVYENTAKAVIANIATNFSAYTFFNDKQGIATQQRYKDNMEVTFRTQVLEANQTRQQTIALAHGTANQKLLEAEANAMVTEQSVYAEMYAYGNLTAEVDLNVSEGLSYIWWGEQ